ncbi:MAG: PAS domain S-box protein [Alphaproteobacteria bacterium]|nr:PAS domain S-box protein [Alphaproteobacteria bacterium]MBU1515108.1 PAS domain S-box protein [Alphaproteobacteria bacterium]MBU2093466.1 PAS domain S-box protein [Alphaproteobacteria bacterium]MBU2152314.1 PAS domain S-box protein [Alphaproteobacteria bacterium]MBU2308128.1 PAS domain S-box protein [Alphaproteobacteria bacterium]
MSMDDTESIEGLRERLRRLEAAVEATGLGLWEWDVRGGALTWNDRNRELYGVPHDRPLVIDDYLELVHPEDRDVVRAAYRAARDQPDGGVFSTEHRTLSAPDGKPRWILTRGRVLKDAEGVRMAVGSNLDITDRKTAEERRSLVLRELAHRAKNGILVMMTIVTQTAKRATGVKDFEEVLMGRLQSMADSQDLVTQTSGRSLRLADLLARALTPFDPSRFDIDPRLQEISISNEMVVAMALLLHELSTNAVKYGALSAPAGRVKLHLADAVSGSASLSWMESGGPEVKPVTRKGFGTRLLDISLRNNGGHVVARFEPAGFQADIYFPLG